MLEPIDRSRAHIALHAAWGHIGDPSRTELAALYGLRAGCEELPALLILLDLMEVECAAAIDIDVESIEVATGLPSDGIALVLSIAGAARVSGRYWTTARDGEASAPFALSRDEWRDRVLSMLGLRS